MKNGFCNNQRNTLKLYFKSYEEINKNLIKILQQKYLSLNNIIVIYYLNIKL